MFRQFPAARSDRPRPRKKGQVPGQRRDRALCPHPGDRPALLAALPRVRERRELAGVSGEILFQTKPQLAGGLLRNAHDQGIRAGFVADDEACGGRDLREGIRARGTGYVLAVRSNCAVTLPSGRRLPVKTASHLVKPAMWQRMRTGSATKGARDYDWAMIEITPGDTQLAVDNAPAGQDDGHPSSPPASCRSTASLSPFTVSTTPPSVTRGLPRYFAKRQREGRPRL